MTRLRQTRGPKLMATLIPTLVSDHLMPYFGWLCETAGMCIRICNTNHIFKVFSATVLTSKNSIFSVAVTDPSSNLVIEWVKTLNMLQTDEHVNHLIGLPKDLWVNTKYACSFTLVKSIKSLFYLVFWEGWSTKLLTKHILL